MDESPFAICLAIAPLSLVQGAVWPHLHAYTCSLLQIVVPHANVDGTVSEFEGIFLDQVGTVWKPKFLYRWLFTLERPEFVEDFLRKIS